MDGVCPFSLRVRVIHLDVVFAVFHAAAPVGGLHIVAVNGRHEMAVMVRKRLGPQRQRILIGGGMVGEVVRELVFPLMGLIDGGHGSGAVIHGAIRIGR